MNFTRFTHEFKNLRIFSLKDIKLIDPGFNDLNLTIWSKKGYITKIRNGWYMFSDLKLKGDDYYLIANRIYRPSYISLELAFNHYGIIPEGVLQITSVTTNKSQIFQTPLGTFRYQSINPSLNWGYKIIEYESQQTKIAEIEKSILDFLYLNPNKNELDHFVEMRFNKDIINSIIDIPKLDRYRRIFSSNSLDKRLYKFLDYIQNA